MSVVTQIQYMYILYEHIIPSYWYIYAEYVHVSMLTEYGVWASSRVVLFCERFEPQLICGVGLCALDWS